MAWKILCLMQTKHRTNQTTTGKVISRHSVPKKPQNNTHFVHDFTKQHHIQSVLVCVNICVLGRP